MARLSPDLKEILGEIGLPADAISRRVAADMARALRTQALTPDQVKSKLVTAAQLGAADNRATVGNFGLQSPVLADVRSAISTAEANARLSERRGRRMPETPVGIRRTKRVKRRG